MIRTATIIIELPEGFDKSEDSVIIIELPEGFDKSEDSVELVDYIEDALSSMGVKMRSVRIGKVKYT